jgi:general secretion pathway protein B
VSFILDALRKSEHERQRSTLPGLSNVPLATPPAQLPRWALVVMGALAAAVLAFGVAWWQSSRAPTEAAASDTPSMIERPVELPPAAVPRATPPSPASSQAAPTRQQTLTPPAQTALAAAATPSPDAGEPSLPAPAPVERAAEPALPSAAALAAQGVALPALRLELHAFSEQPRDRFVFINGRKYVEGERLAEGPQLVAIEPRGAVLAQAGQRFLLVPE